MHYLSDAALQGLKEYTYKPGGYTWLDNLHNPLWNYTTSKLPMWLAPNLITLSGLLGVVFAHMLTVIYLPDFEGRAPSWAYTLAGISVVIYANLDCIDGKQARRTGSSSPLGQLFDHGCDAYVVHLLIGNIMACAGHTCGPRTVIGCVTIMLPWALAQWEEYHTGHMLYGNGYWGVLEALYGTTFFHIVTGVFGPSLWSIKLFEIGGHNFLTLDAVLSILCTTCSIQSLGQIWRVLTLDVKDLPPKERGNKELGGRNAAWHLGCMLFVIGFGSLWVLEPPSSAGECRAAFTTFGTAYAYIATQLIVAHMSKIAFEPSPWAMGILFLGAVNTRLLIVNKLVFAFGALGVTAFGYMHYIVSIVRQICQFLDIWCLSIKARKTS
ncbi:hypothetical protein BSKO_07489 [Bryopsis sp. KO-2023]|nr:hypothetical protein BSKO_07489 [Bryopsis sp. KO-2023]